MTQAFPLEPSLWSATASKAISTPPLDESISADVCVIGGGYAGLSTALHLAERGTDVVVLEAKEPGFGGSGRNGGQVIPGLKYDPDELIGMFGQERGEKLVDFGSKTADAVFDLIDRHEMNVPRVRSGWIQGAHSPETVKTIQSRAEQWARRGAQVRALDKAQTDEAIGNNQYLCSWFDARAGAIQPLSYARELARVAAGKGVRIFGESPATKLTRNGSKWTVNTAGGATVIADRVVIATNGYTGGLWPKLQQTVIATNSFQIATEPLSDNIRKSILPGGRVSSDARRLLFYFRFDHTGRLLLGGRGPFREPNGPQDWEHLRVMLDRLFPQAAGATIDFRWCGRVALTRDFLPHLHEPEPGLLIDIGCMGRGVGLQTAMGKAMADYVATGDPEALPLRPVPVKPLPFHFLQKAYLGAFIAWYRLLDRRGASFHV